MSAAVATSPNKIQICQVLDLTKNIESLSADVNDLIKIVTAHGQEIRSLVEALNSKCSKAELYAAISTAKLQNLKGFPPSNALLSIMGENQKFTPVDHSVINELDHNNSQSSHPATQSNLTDTKTNTKITKLENEIKFLKAQLNEMELNHSDKYSQQDKKILKLIEAQKNFIKNNSVSMRLRKLRENNENDDIDPYSSNKSIHSRGSVNDSNLDHIRSSHRPPRGGILISEDDPEADYYSDRQIGVRLEDLTQSIESTITTLHHPERNRSNSLSHQHHHPENEKASSQHPHPHPELVIDNNSSHIEEFPQEITPRSKRSSINEKRRKSINSKSPKSRRGSIVKIKTRRSSINSQTSVHSTQKSTVTPSGSRRESKTQPLKPFVFGGTGALPLSSSGVLALPPIKSYAKTTSISSASNDDSEYHSDFYQYDAITSDTTRQKRRKQKQQHQKQRRPPQSGQSSDDDNGDLIKAIFHAVSAVSELDNGDSDFKVSPLHRQKSDDEVDEEDSLPKTFKSKMNLLEKSETVKNELVAADDDELSTNSFVNRNEATIDYPSSDINASAATTTTTVSAEIIINNNNKDNNSHSIQITNATTEVTSVSNNSETVSANHQQQQQQQIKEVEDNVVPLTASIPVTPVANTTNLETHRTVANTNEMIKSILKNDGNNSVDSPNKIVSISEVHTSMPTTAEKTDSAKITDSSTIHPSNSPEIILAAIASPRPLSRTGNIVSDDVTVRQQVTLPVTATIPPAGSGAGASPLAAGSSLASPLTANQSIESVISSLLGITVKPSRDSEDQDAYLSALIRQISSVSNAEQVEEKSPKIIEKTFSETDSCCLRRTLSELSITDESPVPQRTESYGKNKQNVAETQSPKVIVTATTTAPTTSTAAAASTRGRTSTEVSLSTKDKDPEPVNIVRTISSTINKQNKKDSNKKVGNSTATVAAAAVSSSGLSKQTFDAITQLIRTVVDDKMTTLIKKQKDFETKQFQSNQHISHVVDSLKKLRDELASLAKSNRQTTDKVERAYTDLTSTLTKLELMTDSFKTGLEKVDQSCSKREKKLANYIDRNLSRMRLETPRFTRDGTRSTSISPHRISPMDYQRPSGVSNPVTSTPLKTISFEHAGVPYISEVPLGGNNTNSFEDLSVISMRAGASGLRAKPSRVVSPNKVVRVTSLNPSLSRQGGLYQGNLSTSAATGSNSNTTATNGMDKKLVDSSASQSSPPFPFAASTAAGSGPSYQAKQQPASPLYITPAPKIYSRKGSFLNAAAAAAAGGGGGESTSTSHNAVNDSLSGHPATNPEDMTTNMHYPRRSLQSIWEPRLQADSNDDYATTIPSSVLHELSAPGDPSAVAATYVTRDYASLLNGDASNRLKMVSALDLGSPTPAVPAAPQPTSFSPRNPSFIRVTKITLSRQNSANINIAAPLSVSSSEAPSVSGRPHLAAGELSDLPKDMNTEMKFPNVLLDIPSPSRDTSPLLIRSRAGSFAIQNLPAGISRQNSKDSSKGDNMFPIRSVTIRSTSPRSPVLPPTPAYAAGGEDGNTAVGLASLGDSHICMTPPISAIPSRSSLSPPLPQEGHQPTPYSHSSSGMNNNITYSGGTKDEGHHAIKAPIKRVLTKGGMDRNYAKMLPVESTIAPLPPPSPRSSLHRHTAIDNKKSTSGDSRRKDSSSSVGTNGKSNSNTPAPPKTEYNTSWSVQKHQKILLQQLEKIRIARIQSGAPNIGVDTTKNSLQLDSKIEVNISNTTVDESDQRNAPPKETNIILL